MPSPSFWPIVLAFGITLTWALVMTGIWWMPFIGLAVTAFAIFSWAFPPAFDARTGAAAMESAEEDIHQSLRILFQTRPGERIMHPTFGCRLHDLVFDPMDRSMEVAIETAISRAILFFEPRIRLERVRVAIVDALDGRLEIMLDYRIRQTNSRHNMVFPFYIREGTLVSDKPVPLK